MHSRETGGKSSHDKRLINGMDASLTVTASGSITILVFTLSKVFYLKNLILSSPL